MSIVYWSYQVTGKEMLKAYLYASIYRHEVIQTLIFLCTTKFKLTFWKCHEGCLYQYPEPPASRSWKCFYPHLDDFDHDAIQESIVCLDKSIKNASRYDTDMLPYIDTDMLQ